MTTTDRSVLHLGESTLYALATACSVSASSGTVSEFSAMKRSCDATSCAEMPTAVAPSAEKSSARCRGRRRSLAQAELLDQRSVPLEVGALEVCEKAPAATYEHQQAAARVVIFALLAQVLCEVVDALGQQRDLDLRGARVRLAVAE